MSDSETRDYDPYDDSVPISQRMGEQRLLAPRPEEMEPDLDLRLDPEPDLVDNRTGVVSLSNRKRKRAANGSEVPFGGVQQPAPEPPGKRDYDVRELASTACEIVGLAVFSAGFYVLAIWIGLVVTGICLVAFGVASSNLFTRPRD